MRYFRSAYCMHKEPHTDAVTTQQATHFSCNFSTQQISHYSRQQFCEHQSLITYGPIHNHLAYKTNTLLPLTNDGQMPWRTPIHTTDYKIASPPASLEKVLNSKYTTLSQGGQKMCFKYSTMESIGWTAGVTSGNAVIYALAWE